MPVPHAAQQPLREPTAAAARSDSNLRLPQEALHLPLSGEAVPQQGVTDLDGEAGG